MTGKNKTILLVEDSADDEELARVAFAECGITNELVVVRDGQEALDYLFVAGKYSGRDVSDQPQLILLDLKLPKVGGLQVLQRIRADKLTRHIVVVMLTSSKEESDLVESYALGVNSYIRKPVDFGQFVDAIRHLGSYWLTLNEAPSMEGYK